jgi:hypothetical protein
MTDIPSHHLIYGTLCDFITGETIPDTDDERYRQGLARFLVEAKGSAKSDIEVRREIETLFANQFVVSKIDFVVKVNGRRFMVVRYGPGSIVTRERSAVAAARVLDPAYIIPVAVATNGQDAAIIDAVTGKAIGEGLDALPDRDQAGSLSETLQFVPLPKERREGELRILNAYDVQVCCTGGPCPLPGAPEG